MENITLEQFIAKHYLRFSAQPVNSRPDSLMSEHPMYHYKCRISTFAGGQPKDKGFTLYFSQGTGITREPVLADVLDCIASDAAGYENAENFEDWAAEYGYDADSRTAERSYKAVKRQAEQLKRVIGAEAYDELLWKTERQ